MMVLMMVGVTVLAAGAQSAPPTLVLGTNLSGMADYGTELPFVDLMHSARIWYTKDAEDPEWDGLGTRRTCRKKWPVRSTPNG